MRKTSKKTHPVVLSLIRLCTEVVPGLPQPPHNLLDDPLLQLSPRVLIPRKKASVFQSKQQARQADVAVDEGTNV
ncbi:hypothetical protein M9458_034732, partial [Cirrhinus mrigala]